MSRYRSPEEVRGDQLTAMGSELGELFNVLSNELIWLYWNWHEYVVLFGGSQARLDILNSSAPFFFHVVQRTLWDETLLGISLLAGSAETGSKKNLSVQRLVPLVPDGPLRERLKPILESLVDVSEFAIDIRNRRIAHRDLDVVLGEPAKPLASATQEKVDAALRALAEVLNAVELHFQNASTAYDFSAAPDGAKSLLYVLRDGLRRREIRRNRIEAGLCCPEDWGDDEPPL